MDDALDLISPTLIIGTGLIGASIGQALTARGVAVYLNDINRENTLIAASRGAGLVAAPRPTSVKLVVVAVPPAVTAAVVVAALEHYPIATVLDVASVKSSVAAAVLASDVPGVERYIGTHPMAGKALAGPLTAVGELFTDRAWAIIPTKLSSDDAKAQAVRLAFACRARVIELDAESHDRAVAAVSHLPQLMSSLMAARLTDCVSDDLLLAGQGVRDVTRIAASDAALWAQIIDGNREPVLAHLRAVAGDLERLIGTLAAPDAVADLIERGNAGVRALPGKHGRPADELVAVVIEIPDTPGALARLFRDIEAAGINVEDLSIEHDAVRTVGFLSVHVEPERADALRQGMRDNGWEIRA
ncbi:MAG: prephenate dehydrogenase [Propionibacteriaceae bacterium]|nr:prephenate dehydrogenase [Propionibacteriaceae bacterium]